MPAHTARQRPAPSGDVLTVGVTGHRAIPAEAFGAVRGGLAAELDGAARRCRTVEALSSLAVGADQLFAELALASGAVLTAVSPGADYESTFSAEELPGFHRLLHRARTHVRLDFPVVDEEAYYAAGAYIAERSDLLLAVWDGCPARGRGGTGDIVGYARSLGKAVVVIWQPGVARP
jgi:hypothetical protein